MLKAIETIYDGYRFRSRLEARWAVFFNTLGVKYEYEKEGYDLDGTWYLPDFWLPEHNCWIEIKGQAPSREEHDKCCKLVRHANGPTMEVSKYRKKVYLFVGDIPLPESNNSNSCCIAHDYRFYSDFNISPLWDPAYGWAECPFCGAIGITHSALIGEFCSCVDKYIRIDAIDKILADCVYARKDINQPYRFMNDLWQEKRNKILSWHDTPRLVAAYLAARQARFEYGEKP